MPRADFLPEGNGMALPPISSQQPFWMQCHHPRASCSGVFCPRRPWQHWQICIWCDCAPGYSQWPCNSWPRDILFDGVLDRQLQGPCLPWGLTCWSLEGLLSPSPGLWAVVARLILWGQGSRGGTPGCIFRLWVLVSLLSWEEEKGKMGYVVSHIFQTTGLGPEGPSSKSQRQEWGDVGCQEGITDQWSGRKLDPWPGRAAEGTQEPPGEESSGELPLVAPLTCLPSHYPKVGPHLWFCCCLAACLVAGHSPLRPARSIPATSLCLPL